MKTSAMKLSRLFEKDETAWLEEMARLVKEKRFDEVDTKNLSEYLLDMAKRDRREVLSRLTSLLAHLLKWAHQPSMRSGGWESTIVIQRHELQALVESKTLRNYAHEVLQKAYTQARTQAAAETGLPDKRFPAECPYTLENLLAE